MLRDNSLLGEDNIVVRHHISAVIIIDGNAGAGISNEIVFDHVTRRRRDANAILSDHIDSIVTDRRTVCPGMNPGRFAVIADERDFVIEDFMSRAANNDPIVHRVVNIVIFDGPGCILVMFIVSLNSGGCKIADLKLLNDNLVDLLSLRGIESIRF